MGRGPILECRRKIVIPGGKSASEDGYVLATKLTYGAAGNQSWAAAVRHKCINHFTNSLYFVAKIGMEYANLSLKLNA